ncbi:MAG: hypothetical protein V9E98_02035 [Candidatus Nanopelagicales bacterium]
MSESVGTIPDAETTPLLSVIDAGRYLGMSRDRAYRAAQAGYLPTVHLSATRLAVPTAKLRELLGLPVTGGAE